MLTNPEAVLSKIFTDARWRKLSWRLLFANIDGVKVGVVLATKSPDYDCFALNKPDIDRLLAGKHTGKLDAAYVVWTRISSLKVKSYCDWVEAEELQEKLKGRSPLTGKFGEFWTFPLDFVPGGIADPDDEPY
jgi:hypothetical protein